MTKTELGTKRVCPNCGARYYDLNRSPIVCPRCGTVFEAAGRARPQTAAKAVKEPVVEEAEEAAPVELVTLEEADEEAAESGAVKVDGAEDEEAGEAEEDDTFLEEEEEDEEDVGDIIGDVDEEER